MIQTSSAHPTLVEIIEDRKHGASELARRGLEMLADAARCSPARDAEELAREMETLADGLREARPAMAPLRVLVGRWKDAVAAAPRGDLESARSHMMAQARALRELTLEARRQITVYASEIFHPGQIILTHSSGGILLGIFEALREFGLHVILTESRPQFESRRLAEHLSSWGCDTTMITDAQAGIFAAQSDAVLVGADSVLRDGSVVNKAGTHLIALAAREAQVPFYVACESYKFTQDEAAAALCEEAPAEELGTPQFPNLRARNFTFDRTPARLVTAWITEEGVVHPEEISNER